MSRKFLFGAFFAFTTACISAANAATDVADYDELLAAVRIGGDINFSQNIGVPTIPGSSKIFIGYITNDVIIDGQGFSLDGSNHFTGWEVGPAQTVNLTLKNIGTVGSNSGFTGFEHNIINQGGIITLDKVLFANNKTLEDTTTAGSNELSGAINNFSTIDLIKDSHFENNIVESTASVTKGGAIMSMSKSSSNATIGSITNSKFINNHAESEDEAASGGAVFAAATAIGTITQTTFESNYVRSGKDDFVSAGATGGALYLTDNSKISDLQADFKYNQAANYANDALAGGGAIYNSASEIGIFDTNGNYISGGITGNFIDNSAMQQGGGMAYGGAIASNGSIGNISGIFEGNRVLSVYSQAYGGAIFNSGIIEGIVNSRFSQNSAESHDFYSYGGAIYSDNTIRQIENVVFEGNTAAVIGGALASAGNINIMKDVTFSDNFLSGIDQSSGGAWYNIAKIDTMQNLRFSGNNITAINLSEGGAVYNYGTLPIVYADFIDNCALALTSYGGALYAAHNTTDGSIEGIVGNFNNNQALGSDIAEGGAIYNDSLYIGNLEISATGNSAVSDNDTADGGAIYNKSVINKIKGNFTQNHVKGVNSAFGGAIYNDGIIESITNSSFVGNYAKSDGMALGGAIYSEKDLNIAAINGDVMFAGNYVESAGVKTDNDIYMADGTTLNLVANNGSITFGGGIDGYYGYKISLSGNGTININGYINNADIIHGSAVSTTGLGTSAIDNVTTNIADGKYLADNNLTLNSGIINIANLDENVHLNNLALNGGTINVQNLTADLSNTLMGGITSYNYSNGGGNIIIESINVVTDSTVDVTSIAFTDNSMAGDVTLGTDKASGPIWRYNVDYDNTTGSLSFARQTAPSGIDVNPEVQIPAVAVATTAAVLNNEIYSRVLNDVDALKDSTANVSSADRSIKNAWVKTFGFKNSVGFKDFVGVDTKFAGLIGGLSSDRINEGKGWSAIYSVYGAYAGGEQKFAGKKITNHGGYFGLGANFYNGDFFIGATVNGGLVSNRPDKSESKKHFNSYIGGVAVKTGYDYHIGNFTIEPNVYASYTLVDAENYTSKSNVRVKFDSMSVIEAAPGLKLSQSFDDGLKGYIDGRYVWNFTQDQEVVADNFILPDIELKSYAEYGIGLEKNWGDIAAGFIEIKRRDGGQNGWNFNLGYKHSF